jgi:hypothetical protein
MGLLSRPVPNLKAGICFVGQLLLRLCLPLFSGRLKRITRSIIKKMAVAVGFSLRSDIIVVAESAIAIVL